MRQKSQIATLLTLAIAAIFLFIVITINLGKVSKKKTIIDNAADSAGLVLASGLGSVANSLRFEAGLYGELSQICSADTVLIVGTVALAAGVLGLILAIPTGGLSLGAAVAIVGAAAGIVGGGLMVASQTLFASYNDPGLVREAQMKFQNMTAEQRLFEGAIQNALFSIVDDPKFVPDVFDVDRDTARNDKITRFNHWYFQRLNDLPRLGGLVDEFYRYAFSSPRVFEVEEDSESMNARNIYFRATSADEPWRVAQWLENDFRPFMQEMRNYGYGVSFHNTEGIIPIPGFCAESLTDLDKFILAIKGGLVYLCVTPLTPPTTVKGLEDEFKSIYGLGKNEIVGTFEVWFQRFYGGDRTETGTWYSKLRVWEQMLSGWIEELNTRQGQALGCINRCNHQSYDGCCSTHPCTDGAGNPSSCCDGGCCGVMKFCGELCGDAHCAPDATCDTPTGGSRPCCDSGVRLAVGPGNCGPFTRIQPYMDRLRELRASIHSLYTEFEHIDAEIRSSKQDPWIHRAIYIWRDITGRDTGLYAEGQNAPESSVHMAYVRITMPGNFRFPNLKQELQWRVPPEVCKWVDAERGQFDIEVGRYDEDLAKQGPLNRHLWRFRFRRNPGGVEQDLSTLRNAAVRFAARLDAGRAVRLNDLISEDEFETLANFCWNNGIVSRVRVHYGPGVTPRREEIATQSAAQRNRDIYIEERFR